MKRKKLPVKKIWTWFKWNKCLSCNEEFRREADWTWLLKIKEQPVLCAVCFPDPYKAFEEFMRIFKTPYLRVIKSRVKNESK